MGQSFDVEVAAMEGQLVARVSGELDMPARAPLTDRLTEPLREATGVVRLVVDLARVSYCDSSGLGALLDVRRVAGSAGVDMVLRNVSPAVARVLDLADIDGWLPRE